MIAGVSCHFSATQWRSNKLQDCEGKKMCFNLFYLYLQAVVVKYSYYTDITTIARTD